MKKRVIIIAIAAVLSAACLYGCQSNSGFGRDTGANNYSSNAPVSASNRPSSNAPVSAPDSPPSDAPVAELPEVDAYRPPSGLIDIDLNADDPSNDKIVFVYDAEGRLWQCYYAIGENDVYLSYSYDGNSIQIYGFIGSIVVADESFEAKSNYDTNRNFVEYQGYYFKGFTF